MTANEEQIEAIALEDIFDYLLDKWHEKYNAEENCIELHNFLGLTWNQYKLWIDMQLLEPQSQDYWRTMYRYYKHLDAMKKQQ